MFDCVLRNGTIVDGSGDPAYIGDLAIVGDRIAAVGRVAEPGRNEIDASGCWITPGFVDPHTHLDAQLCWDASGSPSNRHGVTTVVLGLCGFGIAPCPESGGDYLLKALEVVEEIPYATTRAGVRFEWQSWPEYRDYLETRPLGVNAAGYVPHSSLRFAVMGERARHEVASESDRTAMVGALEEALAAGAIGFATSRGPNHVDGYGDPVPSRLADTAELEALVQACRGRLWQINVETKFSGDATALTREIETYAAWSRAADARLTWSPFFSEAGSTVWRDLLAHNEQLNASGVRVAPQISPVPITMLLRFDERSAFSAMKGFREALAGFDSESKPARKARLADPATRRSMRAGLGKPDPSHPLSPDLERWRLTFVPSRPGHTGKTVAEVARIEGLDPIDLLCDQIVADDLATLIDIPVLNLGREGILASLEDDTTLLALGDAGAHVMSVTSYRYPTYLLETLVQQERALPVETAIRRLTRDPALLHGLEDRGLLAEGLAADVCVIDPERIALGPVTVVNDLPGEAPRLVQDGNGFRAVFVNGIQTIEADEPTGVRPGRMLRSAASG
jgi:N-acyl-D-aspartate/D-glutamate deacylase